MFYKKNTYKVPALVLSSIVLTAHSHLVIAANNTIFDYQSMAFASTLTSPLIGEAILGDNSGHTEATIRLPKLPNNIKQLVTNPKTTNPFAPVYEYLHKPENMRKLQACPFIGAQFELDGDTKTKEWIAATSLYGCIEGQASGNGIDAHSWVIQQDTNNKSRILMESDGMLMVKQFGNDKKQYKQLWTEHYPTRFAPQSKLNCGIVRIKWAYKNTQYKITNIDSMPYGCEVEFGYDNNDFDGPRSDAETAAGIKKATAAVQAVVNRWLPKLKPFR